MSNYRSINKKLGLLAYIFSPVSWSCSIVAKLPVEPKSISNYFVILKMRVEKDVGTTCFGGSRDILGEADTDAEKCDDTDENHALDPEV